MFNLNQVETKNLERGHYERNFLKYVECKSIGDMNKYRVGNAGGRKI